MFRLFNAFLFTLLFTGLSLAQLKNIEFFQVGVEQGLMQATVYSIVQDKYGIMWFGTQDGLIRYSGTDYTEFLHNTNEPGSISNNGINQVLIHSYNDLFLSTWGGGINRLNREQNSFQAFYPKADPNSPLKAKRVQCLLSEDNKLLWAGTSGAGLALFNTKTSVFEESFLQGSKLLQLKDKRIWTLAKDQKGLLWIGTQDGLFVYNRAKNELREINLVSERLLLENANAIRTLSLSSDGKMWVGTKAGFFIFNVENYSYRQYLLNKSNTGNPRANMINCFLELSDKTTLTGTDGEGIFRIARDGSIIANYKNDPLDPSSLSSNDIRCLYQDRSGLLWIGTRGGGVNTTQLKTKRFISFTGEPNGSISLLSKNIRCLLSDTDGGIFMGTNDKGLNYISPGFRKIAPVCFRDASRNNTQSRVLAICRSDDNTVWLATDYGIHFLKKGRLIIEDAVFPASANFPDNPGNIRSLLIPDSDLLLVGSRDNGLYEFSRKRMTWERYNNKTPGFGGDEIFSMKKIGDEVLLGTNNGLTFYNLRNRSFRTYGLKTGSKIQMNDNQIWCICQAKNGLVWLGTSGGLISFNRFTDEFVKYTSDDGFGSNVVYGIIEDCNGNLWLSGTKGLMRFIPGEKAVKNYNEKDGLPWNVYNPTAYCSVPGGFFVFGGVNGITVFAPEKIIDNPYIPTASINKFDVYENGQIIHIISASCPVNTTATLTFSSKQNIFRIGFGNSNYLFPGKNQFIYKMDGVDYDWQRCDGYYGAAYSGLNPGTYIFRVKTTNNDNVWSPAETDITIIINPPFYATWWFRLLIILAIIAGVVFYLRFRLRYLRTMQARLKILVDQKTADLQKTGRELEMANASKDRFFSIIAHDLRSPFQALISFSNMLNSDFNILSEDEKRSMSEKIETVSRSTYTMLENLLQWSYSQTNKLKKKPDHLNLVELLGPVISLNSQAAKLKRISITKNLPDKLVCFADMNMAATVFRNLLSNAVKFTPDEGKILITGEQKEKTAVITIKDNGVGMDRDTLDNLFKIDRNISTNGTKGEKGSGLGLILCYEFIKMNAGELLVESTPDKGTTFTVVLPTGNENQATG